MSFEASNRVLATGRGDLYYELEDLAALWVAGAGSSPCSTALIISNLRLLTQQREGP